MVPRDIGQASPCVTVSTGRLCSCALGFVGRITEYGKGIDRTRVGFVTGCCWLRDLGGVSSMLLPELVRPWRQRFLATVLFLAIPALHLTLTWPVPGGHNIIMGEPTLYFGMLLSRAGLVIVLGHDLRPLAWLSLPGGIVLVVIAGAILQHRFTRSPAMWAIADGAIDITNRPRWYASVFQYCD